MKPAALAIIERKSYEILLVMRKDVPVWVLPGGGIESHESSKHAVQRETWEETSFHIKNIQLQGIYRPHSTLSSLTYVFHAEVDSFDTHQHRDLLKEVRAFRFFSLDALPSNLFFLHKNILMEWAKNPEGGIDRPLVEISYKMVAKLCIRHPWYSIRYLVTRFIQT